MNLQIFSNNDIPKALSVPNILHKHSINSLLEQQDLIGRGSGSGSGGVGVGGGGGATAGVLNSPTADGKFCIIFFY